MSQVSFGAVKQLTRLSPFSAKPKRRPHFGGEGYSRGAKTDPVFAPVRGFNASYEHLRILYGSLRLPTYLGQTVSCSHSEHFMPAKRALRGSLRLPLHGNRVAASCPQSGCYVEACGSASWQLRCRFMPAKRALQKPAASIYIYKKNVMGKQQKKTVRRNGQYARGNARGNARRNGEGVGEK